MPIFDGWIGYLDTADAFDDDEIGLSAFTISHSLLKLSYLSELQVVRQLSNVFLLH